MGIKKRKVEKKRLKMQKLRGQRKARKSTVGSSSDRLITVDKVADQVVENENEKCKICRQPGKRKAAIAGFSFFAFLIVWAILQGHFVQQDWNVITSVYFAIAAMATA